MTDHDKTRGALEACGLPNLAGACELGDASWATVPRAALTIIMEAARSTLPKTKMVDVWRVESVFRNNLRVWQDNDGNKARADEMAKYLVNDGHVCIRVTGPHKQEVPCP